MLSFNNKKTMSKKQSSRKQTTNTIDTIHQKTMKIQQRNKTIVKNEKENKGTYVLLDEFNEK